MAPPSASPHSQANKILILHPASARPSQHLHQRDGAIRYTDPETGFSFSEFKAAYTLTSNIVYRFALPSNPPSGAYDAVIQVVAPVQVGWTGLAWGGTMLKNPLTVGYPNGNSKPTVSSRWANALCRGCTQWNSGSSTVRLNPSGTSRLAFAYSPGRPSTPSSNSSSIPVHEVANAWSHDFSLGLNANWQELLAKNGVS
ncbi:iron reductase domain protein [Periconia macrospinosa]|uniref:Iron reductase domain protein n=1 Tax=Periconia macrospinosa TaxID=97972 RepID=A0A2V1DY97_9PLEO|nr:iron reductase domain protein [Periconia macrospinosa]